MNSIAIDDIHRQPSPEKAISAALTINDDAAWAGANVEPDRTVLSTSTALVRYQGAKGGSGVYQTIINEIPPHDVFVEAFVGSGQVTRHKLPCRSTIVIDADAAVVDAWKHQPGITAVQANAVRWLAWEFTHGPLAVEKNVVVYCDPPYLRSVRSCQRDYYKHEFAETHEHRQLLKVLKSLPCKVLISGYWSALYNRSLVEWRRIDYQTMTRGGTVTESLWCNYPEPFELHDFRYVGIDFRERERIKRKKERWIKRLKTMPLRERAAILEALRDLTVENGDAGSMGTIRHL